MEQPGASFCREPELGTAPRGDAGAAELLALVPWLQRLRQTRSRCACRI